MIENYIPQLLPTEQLKEVHTQHLYDRRRYRYYDREGRLAWTNKEGYNHYTWYLYNNDGDIIEIGESYINAGALGHVLTVYQCTTAEAGDFIRNKAGHDNVLRLAIDPPAEDTIMFYSEPIITSSVIQAIENKQTSAPEELPFGATTSASVPVGPCLPANTTSFANQVLAAIFTPPHAHSGAYQQLSGLPVPATQLHYAQPPLSHFVPGPYYQPPGQCAWWRVVNCCTISSSSYSTSCSGAPCFVCLPPQNTS